MMKALKDIALILMVTLVILATGGFSIYHHICHCAGNVSASVFMEAGCDHENSSATSSCCDMDERHSCCMEESAEDTGPACHDGDCCQTSMQFLKINDSFQPGLEKISLKPVYIVSALLAFDISVDDYSGCYESLISNDLPPPDSGKQIILALHQLKIAPPLV